MCCASSIFSLFGSLRSACAASLVSSAPTGLTAWRASSRLRKSSGVLRNEGSSFFFCWLIVAPSQARAAEASESKQSVCSWRATKRTTAAWVDPRRRRGRQGHSIKLASRCFGLELGGRVVLGGGVVRLEAEPVVVVHELDLHRQRQRRAVDRIHQLGAARLHQGLRLAAVAALQLDLEGAAL